jgi:3-hydroxybutyryl-CoA dehydrogenase
MNTQDLHLNGRAFAPGADRVAVLGGGVMGPGIAMVFAEHGYQVDLCDVSEQAIRRALETFEAAVQLKVDLGLLDGNEARLVSSRLHVQQGSEAALPHASLVVEAVTENREVKAAVYENVLRQCRPDTVVWSNTSTMNVFALAPVGLRDRLMVAHWFAPPHILPLVEVVAGEQTATSLLVETQALLKALGKTPVVLEKFVPGFIINRLLRALGREAFDLIDSGVITSENLDIAVRTSLAPRMVVLGLMQRYDFTGLNLSLRNLSDPDIVDAPVNLRPPALVDRVERGDLGVSTGRGFYDYGARSLAELQAARDARLWKIVSGAGELVSDPKPI